MMIPWWMICFSFLLKSCFINCLINRCDYIIIKSDNSSSRCVSDECFKYVDLISIMVKPKSCKTSFLSLSFSSYKSFILFRDRLEWQIGDLFLSRSKNEVRQLILFVNRLDYNDRPFDHDQLILLGVNIDFYIIYIREILNKNYLYQSIHYNPNNPQWNILKLQFQCLDLSGFDKYPCSTQIVSPSIFARQRPFQLITNKEELITKSNEEKKESFHLIFVILLPLLIVFLSIILFIFVYKSILSNCCFKRNSPITSNSPSLTNPSNHVNTTERKCSSRSLSDSPVLPSNPLNVDQMQNPSEYGDCHLHRPTDLTSNLNNNYEKVILDGISLNWQQHFVPISSSIHF